MSNILRNQIVWDVQSYLELWKITEPYKLGRKFFCTLFKIIQTTRSLNITLAFHESNVPEEILKITRSANFRIFITKDYADFANFTDSKSTIVSKDKHFYQFLKKFENVRILNLVGNNEFVFYTADFLDMRYGYYYYEDYNLWASAMPSKRLNFPGVKNSGPSHAHNFNKKRFKPNPTHRFFQRPEVFNLIRSQTNIPFKQDLLLPVQNASLSKLRKRLTKKYFALLPYLSRVETTLIYSARYFKNKKS